VPIIPNIGPLCALGAAHPHIGFQKKACPLLKEAFALKMDILLHDQMDMATHLWGAI
jgi:hypothetical protein